jgi:hypothetical protein
MAIGVLEISRREEKKRKKKNKKKEKKSKISPVPSPLCHDK